ncbi:BLUF domain-containing protein [Pedobacter sp. SYSU D00535]|uniref:BLUF domain-containing protein n=1 Tax=Pedobacter sp. SYSU D00535 TaxID=2810308 RepID=UPI001A95889D|nr:BLUF domain-containing protein [Pedobacter sp. SYSU D00535]
MALYYLIYSSFPSRMLSDQELDDLLNTARSANSEHEVTGMLICFKDLYVQLIEGEETKIQQLYSNLLRDDRHYNVQTLKEGKIDQRFFPDWSMGFERKDISQEMQEETINMFAEKSLFLLSILDSNNDPK